MNPILDLNINLPSPLQKVNFDILTEKKIQLFIKREDSIHEEITGNKWRKCKYNIEAFFKSCQNQLLTFGGPYSNHIRAVAAIGKELNIPTIGVIRGNEFKFLNPGLQFAEKCGMKLHFVSRTEYKMKESDAFLTQLKDKYGTFFQLPEGGSNAFALKGCKEIVEEIDIDFDYIVCPCGTAGTLSGIITGLKKNQKAIGFSALKGDFLKEEVKKFHQKISFKSINNWTINTSYHFGGYAKKTEELENFIIRTQKELNFPIDFIYNGKALFGLFDLIKKDYFKPNSTIIYTLTGGTRNGSL